MQKNQATAKSRRRQLLLVLLCSVTFIVVVVAIVTVSGSTRNQRIREHLSVNDSRVVANAAQQLERKYNWVVTYEDPPYNYDGDVADVTNMVRKDLDRYKAGEAPKVFVPRTVAFDFDYEIESEAQKPVSAALVIQQLLDAYSAAGNPGIFRMDQYGQRVHIVPVGSRNKTGVLIPHQPLFDTIISIPEQRRNGDELLGAVVAAVTKETGTLVEIGMLPATQFVRYQTTSGVKNQKAREFLSNELDKMTKEDVKLSWRVFCGPYKAHCFLNIHSVRLVPFPKGK